ncbi:MAG: hypothetical protein HQL97_14095 [Magnetococcales bacterium]|nr:hypothetical protein [Magnetococcales bacterium]
MKKKHRKSQKANQPEENRSVKPTREFHAELPCSWSEISGDGSGEHLPLMPLHGSPEAGFDCQTEQRISSAVSISPPRVDTIKEHPILFSCEMVRAILDGGKTQTRRLADPKLPKKTAACVGWSLGPTFTEETEVNPLGRGRNWNLWIRDRRGRVTFSGESLCPYGRPGDRLWVREAFMKDKGGPRWPGSDHGFIHYRADDMVGHIDGPWTKAKRMPRPYARILLEITNIGVVRLQEISEHDAIAEGVDWFNALTHTRREAFVLLWDKIYAKRRYRKKRYKFDDNPLVWVIDFRVVNLSKST